MASLHRFNPRVLGSPILIRNATAVKNNDDGMRPSAGGDAQLAELQRAGAVSDAGGVGTGSFRRSSVVRSWARGEAGQKPALSTTPTDDPQPCFPFYSSRSARIGSTNEARRAGANVASPAMSSSGSAITR